jgi:hypothetical protein
MALVLMDGFDHFSTSALLASKGWVYANTKASFTIPNATGIGAGRLTKGSLSLSSGTNGGTAGDTIESGTKILPSTYTTLIAGCAIKQGGSSATFVDILRLQAGATLTARLKYQPSTGLLQIVNSAGTVIATGTTSTAVGSWCYVEMKIFVNTGTPASGTCELHLNGVSEIASTAGNFGSTAMDRIALCATTIFGSSPTCTNLFDDLYVVDTTGSAPQNTFLGVCRVETLMPAADGANTAWAPNSGTNHFDRVNELTGTFPDGDTSYVSDATPGDRDTYACDSLAAVSGSVFGVQANLYARKDDINARQIAPVIRQAGTNYDGTTMAGLSTTYTWAGQIYQLDPTGSAWTVATVNGNEYGVKEVA